MSQRVVLFRKSTLSDAELEERVGGLSAQFELDPYQIRMALAGSGLAILRPGAGAVEQLVDVLRGFGVPCAAISSNRPRAHTHLSRHFDIGDSAIFFKGPFGELRVPKGARVLAVLGALKSSLINKLMRRSVYTRGAAVQLPELEKLDAILVGDPVLDIYVLDDTAPGGEPVGVRLMPGRFDPSSLGDRAAPTARENFRRLMDAIKEMAGEFHLEMDFGLCQLPGCQFDSTGKDEVREHNLTQLTAYGAYLFHFHRHAGPGMGASVAGAASKAEDEPTRAKKAAAYAAASEDFLPASPPMPSESRWKRHSLAQWGFAAVYLSWMVGFPLVSTVLKTDFTRSLLYWGFNRGFFFTISTAALLHLSFFFLRKKRWMDNTPTSKVRSLAMGMVEIKGTAWRKYNVVSPLSQMPCIFCRVRKYEIQRGVKGGERWVMTSNKASGPVPFELRDETGMVTVDPLGAQFKPEHKRTIIGDPRLMIGVDGGFEKDVKYIEETIPEGVLVYVLGFAEPGVPEEKSVRERVAEKLRFLKQNKAKLMEYDANKDGRIDGPEWETARTEVEREVYKETVDDDLEKGGTGPQAVIRRPPSHLPFVVSEGSEERMTGRFGLLSILAFVAAVGSLATGVALLVGG